MSITNHPVVAALVAPDDRLVVVGGTSVGKTTLVNHWTGRTDPTGIGERTTAATVRHGPQRVVVDTPSLDEHPDLYPWVAGCDVLVWVIDGLRPVSQTERDAVQALARVAGSVMGVVSRADLLPESDMPAVQARCERHCPGPVHLVDLRRTPPPAPPIDRLTTRHRQVLAAVNARVAPLLAAVEAVDQWRQLCRVTPWAEAPSAVAHLHHRLELTASQHDWPAPPDLPLPPTTVDTSGWRDALGGSTRRERQQASAAASWFAEGHVLLAQWLAVVGSEPAIRAELAQLQRWLVEQAGPHATPEP